MFFCNKSRSIVENSCKYKVKSAACADNAMVWVIIRVATSIPVSVSCDPIGLPTYRHHGDHTILAENRDVWLRFPIIRKYHEVSTVKEMLVGKAHATMKPTVLCASPGIACDVRYH